MYGLSAFCFVCLSMDKTKRLNKISDPTIFHMLNSCSYDTKWMEDTFTMHICRKCYIQLYSVYEFIKLCRKNSSVLQGYVELLKHGKNDIAQPIDRLPDQDMVKMEVVIDMDTIDHKLDDVNVNMISANDTMADPTSELSLKDELDVDMSFTNECIVDIKHEPIILNSDTDSESNLVQSIDKRDQETIIRNEKHQTVNETRSICKDIKIEHIWGENEVLVTNVLDEHHNIKTQFSSHSDAIYVNNIENNSVQNSLFNKVYLQNQIEPIERMCNEIQRRETDQNYKKKIPVYSNVNGCLVQKGVPPAYYQPNLLSVYTENNINQSGCSTLNNKVESPGCELKPMSDKKTSVLPDNSTKRRAYNKKVKKPKELPVPNSTDNKYYIVLPVPTLPVPNMPIIEPVPLINNHIVKNTDNSMNTSVPLVATEHRVRNWKRKLEPPRKCDICQKTYDTHDGLRLHLVTHSGMKPVTPEKTPIQKTQIAGGINKTETYETMFIKHMLRTGSL